MMDRRMMVKQYVAEVWSRSDLAPQFGQKWRVFCTGDDKFYLFQAIDRNGCATGLDVPVRKADLRPEVRRMLAHGVGNGEPTQTEDRSMGPGEGHADHGRGRTRRARRRRLP
jgi:hypothetical protein